MAIYNLFSKRQADATKSGREDVYQYDNIPAKLRVQVKQIALEAVGKVGVRGNRIGRPDTNNDAWVQVERLFLREKGLDGVSFADFAGERIISYMAECPTEAWLDLLELIAITIKVVGRDELSYDRELWEVSTPWLDALDEINYRLREAGVGYQLEDTRLVRVDSQYLHAEVVKPALLLLSRPGFEGPKQEFLAAHHHYRAGDNRAAVGMAANALESTFKSIFDERGWPYSRGARISDLVKVARANALWPDYLDASFDQLVATLQSGLPKIRDNDASHGQGAKPKDLPAYIASYALHLAASKIVFITEAAK